ncbi:MAG: hypothetical protein Q9169_005877 [Polycauliona sp. 2 TL-2023]
MATLSGDEVRLPLRTTHAKPVYNEDIDRLRQEEYPMLKDTVYLDHAGVTPYPRSLIEQSSKYLMQHLFGNPHSHSASSQLSTRHIEDVRLRALRFLKADPELFDLVFVANATAGIKLVLEAFREQPGGFWYGYHQDAHTSLIGLREAASEHRCFGHDEEVTDWMQAIFASSFEAPSHDTQAGLFAYPAQSNLNGRRLPLSWPGRLRSSCRSSKRNVYSLLDAAALLSTSPLDLSNAFEAPDYTVLSFYKIFGFPDLGALVVRKESGLPFARRRYFGGGTVESVTCTSESWHIRKQDSLHEQLEDGTLPIHSIVALGAAFDVHETLFSSLERISSHTAFITNHLYESLSSLRHANGLPVCTIYKDPRSSYQDASTQGPIVAFNIRDSNKEWVSNAEVEKVAAIKNIQFRTGGLCNPGGIASFLGLEPQNIKRHFLAGKRCGDENDIQGGSPTGAIRLSVGAMSNMRDITAVVRFVQEFFADDHRGPRTSVVGLSQPTVDFYVEAISIYPIKSCGGWQIPPGLAWDIRPQGLAWDREWCLVHQGTKAALSQKRIPRMALLRPTIDLEKDVLRVRFDGILPPSIPNEITIPLSLDPASVQGQRWQSSSNTYCPSRVCGDSVSAYIYTSPDIVAFFTAALSTPCTLARYPPGPSSARYSKLHLRPPKHQTSRTEQQQHPIIPGAFPPTPPLSPSFSITTTATESQPQKLPILLSNESPILTISRSSLNHLNQIIATNSPQHAKPAAASVFRANIILAQSGPAKPVPYDEDNWTSIRILSDVSSSSSSSPISASNSADEVPSCRSTDLNVLGLCRRCQMVCIDQTTAERSEEPFVTLAKTRRMQGDGMGTGQKVFFGVHCALGDVGDGDGGGGGREKEGRRTVRVGDRVVPVRRDEDGG